MAINVEAFDGFGDSCRSLHFDDDSELTFARETKGGINVQLSAIEALVRPYSVEIMQVNVPDTISVPDFQISFLVTKDCRI